MKKTVIILMLLALLLSLSGPALAAEESGAPLRITVNGVETLCESYRIEGGCYVRLRDFALLLSGSGNQFDVEWDAAARTVTLTTGRPYASPSGSEMRLGLDRSERAVVSAQTFLVDGEERGDLSVYNIGGSNFFELGQLGDILGFAAAYDAAANTASLTGVNAETNGDAVILYTSDIHCAIDMGFGYVGLEQMRASLEALGNDVILVDDGDNIQGQLIGTMTRGAALTDLMNEMGYSVATPGNHEFGYGMERFLSLAEQAEFDYVSCTFNRDGELVFAPYVLRELGGHSVAFVGVSTPETLWTATPSAFQNEAGEYVYGFYQDATGEGVYRAVQTAVDAARAEGAEYVIALAHLGNNEESSPWSCADVIGHTSGIDVLLDGHSHDTDQTVIANALGEGVIRSACGTNFRCIGWCRLAADGRLSAGLYSWDGADAAPETLGLENRMRAPVEAAVNSVEEMRRQVIGTAETELTINDPAATGADGRPQRRVRRAETNLGDFCADAYRDQTGADVAFVNGGGVRASVAAGEITFNDLYLVQPYGNYLCLAEVSGRQILDALEWGARAVPSENGGFLQVSGLTYEIHSYIESPCISDETGMFVGVEGARRVKNVLVGGEPIDPDGTYTLAGHDYMLIEAGDGFSMFRGAPLLQDSVKLDSQTLIDYITQTLGGSVGASYADPYGQGRITVVEQAQTRSAQEIIEELAVDYGTYGAEASEHVQTLLKELSAVDPDLGKRWEAIMDLWTSLGDGPALHYGVLPDGLADTDALCIVALGFQLEPDGTMRDELIERLQVVRSSAEKYPNAYIVCTGGGTAVENEAATEAGEMAKWLIENGVAAERVIVEDRSLTTAQNAIYTYDILTAQYPSVRQLAIVSSDYHIATGVLLFGAEATLRAAAAGGEQLKIVSNAAWQAPSGSLSSMFQAGALIELSGDMETAFDIYFDTYDIHALPPLR